MRDFGQRLTDTPSVGEQVMCLSQCVGFVLLREMTLDRGGEVSNGWYQRLT